MAKEEGEKKKKKKRGHYLYLDTSSRPTDAALATNRSCSPVGSQSQASISYPRLRDKGGGVVL